MLTYHAVSSRVTDGHQGSNYSQSLAIVTEWARGEAAHGHSAIVYKVMEEEVARYAPDKADHPADKPDHPEGVGQLEDELGDLACAWGHPMKGKNKCPICGGMPR